MARIPRSEFNANMGARIRLARLNHRPPMSQGALGDKLGISFQQVQKYEKGHNRVSTEQLVKIAAALGRPIGEFFDDVPVQPGDVPSLRAVAEVGSRFDRLSPAVRRRLLSLVDVLLPAEAAAPEQVPEAA